MEFVIRTVYSYDLLLRFNSFFAKSKKFFWVFMTVFDIIMSAYISFCFGFFGFDIELFMHWLLLMSVTVLCLVIYFIIPRFTLRKAKSLDAVCTATFTDEQIEIYAETVHSNEQGVMKYSIIHKVMEDENCFYLFRTKNQAHIIDKNGFVKGNAADFREFLRSKVEPKKFKCK